MATKLEVRVDKHDKQIAAIQKLILTGMKMINQNSADIRALIKSQRETARLVHENAQAVRDLLRSLGRQDQANGHGKPPKGLR